MTVTAAAVVAATAAWLTTFSVAAASSANSGDDNVYYNKMLTRHLVKPKTTSTSNVGYGWNVADPEAGLKVATLIKTNQIPD